MIINTLHFSIFGKHNPPSVIFKLLKPNYYFEHLKSEILQMTKSCFLCLALKMSNEKPVTFGAKRLPASAPRQRFMADYACGLPNDRGFSYVLIFICEFSGFIVAQPTKTRNIAELKDFFKSHILAKFGIIDDIYSDNEGSLTSKEFTEFLDELGITHSTCCRASAFSNGIAETAVGLIKSALRIYTKATPLSWVDLLPFITISLNSRRLSFSDSIDKTPITPEILMYGNSLQNTQLLKTNIIATSPDEYNEIFQQSLKNLHDFRATKRRQIIERQRITANKGRKEPTYRIGEIVMVRYLKIADVSGSCMMERFRGPWVIKEIYPRSALVQLLSDESVRKTFHFQHLKKVADAPTVTPVDITNETTKILKRTDSTHKYNLRSSNPKIG